MGILLVSLNQPPYPCPVSFNWVGVPLIPFNQASPQYLSTGWVFLSIFQMSPIQFLPTGWVFPSVCQPGPTMGYLRTRRDLPKFVFTPQGGSWAQGATAGINGTKAPVPPRVQVKEESRLQFALLVAITADKKRCSGSCIISFIWGKMKA